MRVLDRHLHACCILTGTAVPNAAQLSFRYKHGIDLHICELMSHFLCPPSLQKLFFKWGSIQVRLDVWRRLARGCTSESHPLYGTFMAKLSSCIFEWDTDDYERLLAAKVCLANEP